MSANGIIWLAVAVFAAGYYLGRAWEAAGWRLSAAKHCRMKSKEHQYRVVLDDG